MFGPQKCRLFCYGRALGINGNEKEAELEQIVKKARKERSLATHPDKNPNNVHLATKAQQLINTAVKILSDKYSAFSYLEQGIVVGIEHKCNQYPTLIQFIEDILRERLVRTTEERLEKELNSLKEELNQQKQIAEELNSTLEAKEQSIDRLNTFSTISRRNSRSRKPPKKT